MKNCTAILLALLFGAVMVPVTILSVRHMQPIHALAVLISQLCICVAAFTWIVSAMWHRRKYRLSR